jgi:glycosyltransferase involved in cell wall biosynthesis
MRIGINTIGFWPGKIGGAETYLRNLVDHLQRLEGDDDYTVLCDESVMGEFNLINPRFLLRMASYRKGSAKKMLRSLGRALLRTDILKAEPRYLNLDLVHHPFGLMKSSWSSCRSVLTFYDLQHRFFPGFFTKEELARRDESYLRSAQLATRIIAISEYTKKSLIEEFGIPGEKVDVIYIGPGDGFRPDVDTAALAEVRGRYHLERPFMIYPAANWPHKNHPALLQALRILKQEHRFEGELVLSGIAVSSFDSLLQMAKELGVEDNLKVIGYVPAGDLPALYNLAELMVFPSLFEGFGIPVVEAMASGCPVACSNSTSLPEVIGDAGVMFDPTSPGAMAQAIAQVWSNPDCRNDLRQRGLERTRLFSWTEMARKTYDVYRKTVSC